MRQVYNDSRLAYREGNGAPEHITLSGDELDTIWQPDTFVRNERKLVFHENLQSYSAPNMYARIYPDGKIQMSQRVTMQLSCPKLKYQLEASNEAQCSMDLASCKYFYHLDIGTGKYSWGLKNQNFAFFAFRYSFGFSSLKNWIYILDYKNKSFGPKIQTSH